MRTGSASVLGPKGQLTLQGEPSGFNPCKGVKVQFQATEAMFRELFYHFIPSIVAIVRGIKFTHEDRVSVL